MTECDVVEQLGGHVVRLVQLSYRMETERYDSLLSTSGRLLTCVSILLVALISLMPFLFGRLEAIAPVLIFEFCAVILVIMASFICALIAQYRFEYKSLQSPAAIANLIVSAKDDCEGLLDIAENYALHLEGPYQSMRARNERLTKLLISSTVLLYVAIGMVLCSGIVDVALLMGAAF